MKKIIMTSVLQVVCIALAIVSIQAEVLGASATADMAAAAAKSRDKSSDAGKDGSDGEFPFAKHIDW